MHVVIFSNIFKEYEIITLIYNRKSCRLDVLLFCAPDNIIPETIIPGSKMFEGKRIWVKANW